MRITYVVYGEILAPVVRSQTFPLLRGLRERGHEVSLVVVTSPRRHLAPGRYAGALRAADEVAAGRVRTLTHLPRHLSWRWVSRGIRRALQRFGTQITHCRQSRAALAAGRTGAPGLVADLRGLRPEEFLLGLGREEEELSRCEARSLAGLRSEQREALARARVVVCVSEAFRLYLGGGDGIRAIPNASLEIPAPSPEERARHRREFGLSAGDLAFVYSGSLAAWQCAREAVQLYGRVRSRVPEARVILLTHGAGAGEELLREEGITDGIVRNLTPEETRRTLPIFDFALLLREPSLVNRVAAPVKFAEYLHAGLPVILTKGIGDTSPWVRERGLGILLPSLEDSGNPDRVWEALGAQDPERCRCFARERLTFEVTIPQYEDAYRRALALATE